MKIVSLAAENYKRLRAIEITPSGDVVTIGGRNGAGKSSILDAIWVGLVGKTVAPPKPIRDGEEQAHIRLDLGELIITRTFTDKGGKVTDTVKVQSAEGLTYSSPQSVLDALLGHIGFDPFAFVQMRPDDQAATLRDIVPLSIDLDEYAEADKLDYDRRRDINRDVVAVKAQVEAIVLPATLPEAIDRDALMATLANAADHNTAIERERMDREQRQQTIDSRKAKVGELTALIGRLSDQIATTRSEIDMLAAGTGERENELAALPALVEPIDTEALRQKISEAESVSAIRARAQQKRDLIARYNTLKGDSEALTNAMETREAERKAALAKAKMPVSGLGIEATDKGQRVTFNGVPFEQASTAEQLRISTAIAMAANPTLRVLRIKDGSLLDDDSMALLAEMAKADDFQLFVEVVSRADSVGIIIEDGAIVGGAMVDKPDKAKPTPKKSVKAEDKAAGSLL